MYGVISEDPSKKKSPWCYGSGATASSCPSPPHKPFNPDLYTRYISYVHYTTRTAYIILYIGERPVKGILLHSAANVPIIHVYRPRARDRARVYACACAFTPAKRQRGNLSTRRC